MNFERENDVKTVTVALILIILTFANMQGKRCIITIKNGSNRDFYRLHISWNRDRAWGPNLLEGPLKPGMAINQVLVPADYDVLAVDANESSCIVKGVSVSNDMTLLITDQRCQR